MKSKLFPILVLLSGAATQDNQAVRYHAQLCNRHVIVQALADVLFGTFNPGGRLPYTIYPASFTNETSMFDVGMRPNATSGNPGRTYRFYTGQVVSISCLALNVVGSVRIWNRLVVHDVQV